MSQMGGTFVTAVPAVPVGSMQAFAGSSAPTGWLLCDGTAVSRTTYSNLFSVISTTYGVGDGSTTFGLPDMRGRVPMGAGTGNQQGGTGSGVITGGTSLAARTAGQFGGDERLQSHTHTSPGQNLGTTYYSGGSPLQGWNAPGVDGLSNSTTDHSRTGKGSGENMPPFVVLNYIIKAIPDTPRGGMTATFTPPIVTSLPLVPQFGDQVVYAADATNGVYWLLQYDASGTYPWKFIGGAPLYAYGGGGGTSSTSYVDCAGASMTIALAGDYVFDYKCHFQLAAGESGFISCFFGTTATDANGSLVYGSSANIDVESGRTTRQTIATANSTVKTQNRMGTAVSRAFTCQTLLATPIRVKA